MTIKDLKKLLEQALENLDNFNDDDEVDLYSNTYFLKTDFFLATHKGFIDLDHPTEQDNEDEDDW